MIKSRSFLIVLFVLANQLTMAQTRYDVMSEAEFEAVHDQAASGDSIVWRSGVYEDVFMSITTEGIIVTTEQLGSAIFTGASKVEIRSDHVTLSGLQFVGGDLGTGHVIRIWGSYANINNINIQDYTCHKYLIIEEESRETVVSYSNFENRLNLDDKNILSVLVGDEPGYHFIQYCSFKNFDGTGGDMGIEPIRIGLSTQGHLNSRTTVEYCYFTKCDGDGEIISNKAAQNVFRYNTFEDNPKAELVLRHGDEAIVYGNFFLNNKGGIRVREGQNHFIYNNYFSGLKDRAIFLQNDPADPLENIYIYFNTVIDSDKIRLGGTGDYPPENVLFANNIFAYPENQLFGDPTGNESWIGNISWGSLGIARPAGITDINPQFVENDQGYFQLEANSPAIDEAESGYTEIPLYPGMEYDSEILLDLIKTSRPSLVSLKDIGAVEFEESTTVQPRATENNTGPVYLQDPGGVNLTSTVNGNGSVNIDPAQNSYFPGQHVTIYAIPDSGNSFTGWSGDITSEENPLTFTITHDIEVVANFIQDVLGLSSENIREVYPNPVSSIVQVPIPADSPPGIQIEFISNSGKLKTQEVQNVRNENLNFIELDISDYSHGIYFIVLRNLETGAMLNDSSVWKILKE